MKLNELKQMISKKMGEKALEILEAHMTNDDWKELLETNFSQGEKLDNCYILNCVLYNYDLFWEIELNSEGTDFENFSIERTRLIKQD